MKFKRGNSILKKHVGTIVEVHNGLKWVEVGVRKGMEGMKFGCLVVTKRLGSTIHEEKKKKKGR